MIQRANMSVPSFVISSHIAIRTAFLDSIPSCMDTQLNEYEHPYKWKLREQLKMDTDCAMETLSSRLEESSLSETELPFNFLMNYISLAYECSLWNKIEEGLNFLQRAEAKFMEHHKNEYTRSLGPAFMHVLRATQLSLLVKRGDITRATEVVLSIPKLSKMDWGNRAAAQYGFPALFVGNFGLVGCQLALNYLSKAIEQDPIEPMWFYFRAEFLGELERASRVIDKMPSDEEFQLVEKALAIRRGALFTSYLAAQYRQCAKELDRPVRVLAGRSKDRRRIDEMNEISWSLYRESIEINGNCPEVLFRCARGFLYLPLPFRDINTAKKLLEKAIQIAPNSGFGNLVMAEFHKINNEPQKAIEHFRICERKKLYGPTMALIRLEYQLNLPINFIERLENLLGIFKTDLERAEILYELVTYSNCVLNDLYRACEYANRILEYGKLGDFVLQCRPSGAFCTPGFREETLYSILVERIQTTIAKSPIHTRYLGVFLHRLLARKIDTIEPISRENAVTFSKASSEFALYNISNRNTWRRHQPYDAPVLSWRRQSVGPSAAIRK